MKEFLAQQLRTIIHLTDEQLELVLKYFEPYQAAKNELLVTIGTVNRYMNFINEGCVRFYFVKEDGQEVTRHLSFEKEFATGLASFITQKPSIEALQAMEDCSLLRISRHDFYYLLNIIPAWEKFFRSYLESSYTNNLNIFEREMTKDAKARYLELLKQNPKIVDRLPHKMVAAYLNMTPETLSRIKAGLKPSSN